MKAIYTVIAVLILSSCQIGVKKNEHPTFAASDLKFTRLSESWDEAIPLGNGILGALIWKKDNKLRLSLDRADLWDLRPMENLDKPEWRYSWVKEQWVKNTYSKVQEMFDVLYDRNPAPSKIPGGALEFDISSLGGVESVKLNLKKALCEIKWKNGVILEAYINAESPVGWFKFKGLNTGLIPDLIAPAYNLEGGSAADNPVTGQDLRRLGYPGGAIDKTATSITYD
jgi:alpha-L-fucosidase 2